MASLPDIVGIDLISGQQKIIRIREAKLGTVIVFLSARCPCSQSHQPELNLIAEDWAPIGFQFVGIHSNVNETLAEAKKIFSDLSFPVIQDQNAVLADEYQALKTPHVFVLNPEGKVSFQGGIDDSKTFKKTNKSYLRAALSAITKKEKVLEDNVRTLGCVIERNR